MRHRFATKTLVQWYRSGQDPERRLPLLSTYLGHVHVSDTQWYLEGSPELMREAMQRLQHRWVGAGAHVRLIGKGRKERCTPIARSTLAVLRAWLREPQQGDGQVLFPNAKGERLSVHGVQYLLNEHRVTGSNLCPSLKHKRVTVHRLRHTMAMDLLQAGVDRSVIALWLGHEHVETTQIYLEATIAMKEKALAKTSPPDGTPGRYKPGDRLLAFLNSL